MIEASVPVTSMNAGPLDNTMPCERSEVASEASPVTVRALLAVNSTSASMAKPAEIMGIPGPSSLQSNVIAPSNSTEPVSRHPTPSWELMSALVATDSSVPSQGQKYCIISNGGKEGREGRRSRDRGREREREIL